MAILTTCGIIVCKENTPEIMQSLCYKRSVTITDLVLGTTLLVIGILSLLKGIHLPPAAAYTMIGVGSLLFLIGSIFALMVQSFENRTFEEEKLKSLPSRN